MIAFELWETTSGNLMGSYGSEGEALVMLAEAVQSHGYAYLETIALIREGGRGRARVVATGSQLAERVEAQAVHGGPPG